MADSHHTLNHSFLNPAPAVGLDLEIVEHRGERVLTLQMIDKVHERADGTARRNFNEHRARMIEGEDYAEITQADEIRALGFVRPQGGTPSKVILLTESGYLMLVKSFTDDLAWQVQRQLVKSYFRRAAVPTHQIPASLPEALRLAADNAERADRAEAVLAVVAPKAEALDLISASQGSVTLTQASKLLGIKLADLTRWMNANRWIYRQNGSWVAFRDMIENKRLEYKEANYTDQKTGMACRKPYCHITPKGLTKLAIVFGVDLKDAA